MSSPYKPGDNIEHCTNYTHGTVGREAKHIPCMHGVVGIVKSWGAKTRGILDSCIAKMSNIDHIGGVGYRIGTGMQDMLLTLF